MNNFSFMEKSSNYPLIFNFLVNISSKTRGDLQTIAKAVSPIDTSIDYFLGLLTPLGFSRVLSSSLPFLLSLASDL